MKPSAIPVARCSAKQEDYVRGLLLERVVPAAFREKIGDPHTLSSDAATRVIDILTTLPRAPRALDAGLYLCGGTVVWVRISKQGRPYASVLSHSVGGQLMWGYVQGLISKVKPADRLTRQQAAELSATTGSCVLCGGSLGARDHVAACLNPSPLFEN